MIKINEMAKRLGVSVQTLQKWDRKGILIAKRNPNNRRYYTEEQYLEYMGKSNAQKGKTIAYATSPQPPSWGPWSSNSNG